MKKNIVFIIVDSVYREHCLPQSYKETSMPFLNSLCEKGFSASRMYSQAPFTEAALTPLLSGEPLLNKGAYMNRLRYRTSMMEVFQKEGYDTFINHYYPSIYPSAMFPGISDLYYVNPFDFLHVWEYRLQYFQPLFLKKALSDSELTMLYDILKDNFKAWIQQYDYLLAKDKKVSFMQQYMAYRDEVYTSSKQVVSEEYEKFKLNAYDYMQQLFEKDKQHPLFQVETLVLNNKLNDEQRTMIHDRYYAIFERIYKANKQRNLRNTKFPMKRMVKAAMRRDWHSVYQYLAMYQNSIQDKDLFQRINGKFDCFKPQVSTSTYFQNSLDWLDQRDSKKPFCMYLHVDDAHWPETFFSYDNANIELLDNEFQQISEYLDRLPTSYHGALTMELSHRYVDSCLKKLYDELQKRSLMEDCIFVVTADHGFSFSFNPIRTNYVNNLHRENYNTPFILYDGSHKGCKENFFTTVDIAPTILDAAGICIPEAMSGQSMLKSEGKSYAISEYMGGGCPDMLRRPFLLTIRTIRYSIAIEIKLQDCFSNHILRHVYDLKKDANEYDNIATKINKQSIQEELNLLKQRFEEIQKDFKENKNAFN